MKPQPRWLAEKLAVIERKAVETDCPGCGAPVLAGLDGDRCALSVVADREPTSGALGELRALMAGLETYSLVQGELGHRDDFHHRAARSRHPIHVEHRCPGGTA
jgi:hypothetical protein